MKRLEGIHKSVQNRRHVGGLWIIEQNLQQEIHEILKKKELMWFQRLRTKWITDGDRNTKYYHIKTVHHRRKNKTVMVKNNEGRWVEEED